MTFSRPLDILPRSLGQPLAIRDRHVKSPFSNRNVTIQKEVRIIRGCAEAREGQIQRGGLTYFDNDGLKWWRKSSDLACLNSQWSCRSGPLLHDALECRRRTARCKSGERDMSSRGIRHRLTFESLSEALLDGKELIAHRSWRTQYSKMLTGQLF